MESNKEWWQSGWAIAGAIVVFMILVDFWYESRIPGRWSVATTDGKAVMHMRFNSDGSGVAYAETKTIGTWIEFSIGNLLGGDTTHHFRWSATGPFLHIETGESEAWHFVGLSSISFSDSDIVLRRSGD